MAEVMDFEDLIEALKDASISNTDLHAQLLMMNEIDIAGLVNALNDPIQIVRVLKLLNKNTFSDVFAYLDSDAQAHILKTMSDTEITTLVSDLFADDAVDMLEELPSDIVSKILNNATPATRHILNKMLNYEEDTAGSLMTVEYVSFSEEMTVRQAFAHIREVGVDKETLYTCFVTNDAGVLIGRMSTKKILIAEIDEKVGSLMDLNPIKVNTGDHTKTVAEAFKKYDVISLPVVDNSGVLVGIITVDDVLDIIHQINTEQIQMMYAIAPSDKPYLKTTAFGLATKRIFWLFVLLLLDFFSSAILGVYQSTLERVTILAMSIPMLMGSGGNAGSQASTLVIRGIALGEIKGKDTVRIISKEFCVAVMAGITLAPLAVIKVLLIDRGTFTIAIIVALSLVFTLVIAKSIGCILPIIAKKFKLDPAVLAAPLITTIVDISALLIYFGLATAILHL